MFLTFLCYRESVPDSSLFIPKTCKKRIHATKRLAELTCINATVDWFPAISDETGPSSTIAKFCHKT